jgi:tetratricopeptide (TPR) repeat protein
MAKKLNKKVVIILLVLAGAGALGVAGAGFYVLRGRDPQYCLKKAEAALQENDYKTAERFFGRACAVAKTNREKIENYFRYAEFQLIQNQYHQADWSKALGCWNQILRFDPKNETATRKLFDYFYEVADLGQPQAWKQVQDYAQQLLKIYEETSKPLDPQVLLAHGRAALEIARSGAVSNPLQLLQEAAADFQRYLEIKPDDAKGYESLAECIRVRGLIESTQGNLQARETARQEAEKVLQQAVEQSSDKPAAWAAKINFELETLTDPNQLGPIRQQIENLIQTLPASPLLYTALSSAYERGGNLSRSEELMRASAAMRQAVALEPQNIRSLLRLAALLHRLGSVQKNPALVEEALQIAENALQLPDAQEQTGPRQSFARGNQYALHSFIAQIHIETILEGKRAGRALEEFKSQMERVRTAVDRMTQLLGSAENPAIQKWQGLIALAEGQQDKAIRQLYKAYEQSKALDAPNEPSQIDSYLCYVLAREMADQNVFGMYKEFLEKALFNRSSVASWKPDALIEYAQILIVSRNYPQAVMMIRTYENSYGSTPETERLRLRAFIEAGFTQEAEQALAAMNPEDPETISLRLLLGNRKILSLAATAPGEEETPLTEEKKQQLKALYEEQTALFSKLLQLNPEQIDTSLLLSTCHRMIRDKEIEKAQMLVNAFLRNHPDEPAFLILQKQMAEPDPMAVPSERMAQLTEDALQGISDSRKRLVSLAQFYASSNQPQKAVETWRQAFELFPDDVAVAGSYYESLLNQKSFDEAEKIAQKARQKNLDGCGGSFYAAQMAMARENFDAALRLLDECLTLRPLLPQAWLLKSRIFLSQNKMEDAVNAAQTAARMNPLSPDAILHYASLLQERNARLGGKVTPEQAEEAERMLLFAMLLNPGNRNLQSYYAEITFEKNPERSLAMRQQLFKSNPTVSNAVLLGNMAMRMAERERDNAKKQGLYQVAANAFQKALELEPNNQGVLNTFAEFLRRTGRSAEAESLLSGQTNVLWRFYLRDGQYEKAEAILNDLFRQNPSSKDTLRGLILVAQGKGDRAAVHRWLDTLLPLAENADEELWVLQRYLEFEFTESIEKQIASFRERYPNETQVLLLDAWYRISRGQLQDALEKLNEFLAANPEHAGAWRLRGRVYRLMGDYPKAIDSLLKSKTIEPSSAAQIELANVYLESGQMEAAIGELKSGLNEPQAPMQLRVMLENIYEQRKRTADLKRFYQETLDKYPDNAYWHFRAGQFYLEQKDYPAAEQLLAKAWELSRKDGAPGDGRTLDYYMETLLQSKSYNKLLAFAAENIDSPHAAILYTYVAQTHAELGQKDKAVQNFFQALEKAGTNIDLMNGIVTIIVEKTGPETVAQWCSRKLSQNPKSIEGLLGAVSLSSQTGQYNQAIQYINTCLDLLQPNQMEWIQLSLKKANIFTMAYAQTADPKYLQEAMTLMEKMLEILPNNHTVLNNLAYMLADNNQNLEKALEYSRKACQLEMGNPVYLDTYAYIHCLLGRFEEAHQALLRTIQLHEARNEPIPWEVFKHLGMAQEGLGKKAEAVAAYRKAVEAAGIPAKEKETLESKIRELSL